MDVMELNSTPTLGELKAQLDLADELTAAAWLAVRSCTSTTEQMQEALRQAREAWQTAQAMLDARKALPR